VSKEWNKESMGVILDSGSLMASLVEIVLLDDDMRSVEVKQRTNVKFFYDNQ
jgi:hypothetical protein